MRVASFLFEASGRVRGHGIALLGFAKWGSNLDLIPKPRPLPSATRSWFYSEVRLCLLVAHKGVEEGPLVSSPN